MSRSTNYFGIQEARGKELVCNPAIKIKFSKKLGLYVRTWFTIERGEDLQPFFKQHNSFHEERSAEPRFWRPKPFNNLEAS